MAENKTYWKSAEQLKGESPMIDSLSKKNLLSKFQ